MPSIRAVLLAYVIGGLTFIPFLVLALVCVIWYTSPEAQDDTQGKDGRRQHVGPAQLDAESAEIKNRHKTSTRLYRCGWVTVRRTFDPVADVGGDSSYMNMMATSYRSFVDSRSKNPRKSRPKDRFYAILKDTVLFLYEDEQESDCYAAIKLPLHEVAIVPEKLMEGELFMKKNGIRLTPVISAGCEINEAVPSLIMRPTPAPNSAPSNGATMQVPDSGGFQPWYIFPSINHDKEDWYHSLVASSRLNEACVVAKDADLFDPNDMGSLVEAIDDQPDPIPTRWMNAMIGRLFFSVYRTAAVEDYIVRKLMRKLTKVNKPDFLGEIEVKEVDVGNTTPFFSKPMLKELTAEGDASMEMQVKYTGNFKICISTVATLNLGQRFKSYSVKLVLAVILKDLEGTVLFKVKRPPSNRLWFGFTTPPKVGLRIEPVVSTRQIKWSLVTKPIESRLRELIAESIVLPHMDDIAFFDTKDFAQRGGIFGECARKEHNLSSATGTDKEPTIEAEGSRLMPGVPNPNLSQAKGAEQEGLRQRTVPSQEVSLDRSASEMALADSNVTGSAAPLDGTSPRRPASTVGGYGPSAAGTESEHARKRSWFSAGSDAVPTAGDLDADTIGVHKAEKPRTVSDGPTVRASAANLPDIDGKSITNPEGAVDRLRGILDAGKATSMPGRIQTSAAGRANLAASSQDKAISGTTFTASPAASLHRTSSGSSGDSAQLSTNRLSSTGSKDELPSPSKSKASSLFRRTSDKSSTLSRKTSNTTLSEHRNMSSLSSDFADQESLSGASTFTNSTTSSNATSAILQGWKSRATDKQAIQAGVNQAKDAMSKWGNKWQAYRKAQQAGMASDSASGSELGDAAQSPVISRSDVQAGTPVQQRNVQIDSPSAGNTGLRGTADQRAAGHTTPEQRSRSSSLLSTSPKGLFQPFAATTTTSLSTGEAIASSEGRLEPNIQEGTRPNAPRRVPPPSVPTSLETTSSGRTASLDRTSQLQKPSYKPAQMMAIPGIAESRRYHASSHDLDTEARRDIDNTPPPLPSRPAGPPVLASEVSAPSDFKHFGATEASPSQPDDVSRVQARTFAALDHVGQQQHKHNQQDYQSDPLDSQLTGAPAVSPLPVPQAQQAPPLPSRPIALSNATVSNEATLDADQSGMLDTSLGKGKSEAASEHPPQPSPKLQEPIADLPGLTLEPPTPDSMSQRDGPD